MEQMLDSKPNNLHLTNAIKLHSTFNNQHTIHQIGSTTEFMKYNLIGIILAKTTVNFETKKNLVLTTTLIAVNKANRLE